MTNYTNFFSSNLVQSSQNTGQNIALTKEISTLSWNGSADFVMAKVLNIRSSLQEVPFLILAKVEERQPFQDLIIINRTERQIAICDERGVDHIVHTLDIFDAENPGASAGYFYSTTNVAPESGSPVPWVYLSFNTGDIPADIQALAGAGLESTVNNVDQDVIQQAMKSKIVNQATYQMTLADLALTLVYNGGAAATAATIYWTLPTFADFPEKLKKTGFFVYVSNVNSPAGFYVKASTGDTINGSTTAFNLALNTSTMFVCDVIKGVVNWYAILTNPSPGITTFPTYFPCKKIESVTGEFVTYTPNLNDNGSTLIFDTNNGNMELEIDTTVAYENGNNINVINAGKNILNISLEGTDSTFRLNNDTEDWYIGPGLSLQLVYDGNKGFYTVGQGDTCNVVYNIALNTPTRQADNGATYYQDAVNNAPGTTLDLSAISQWALPGFKFRVSQGVFTGDSSAHRYVNVTVTAPTTLNSLSTNWSVCSWNFMLTMDENKNWWAI